MRRVRLIAAVVFLAAGVWVGTFGSSVSPAQADPATFIFSDCCVDGTTGVAQTIQISASDDNNFDDGTYTGTITVSAPAGVDFTITPNDGGANSHKYTFKPGDVVDGDQLSKDFSITFNTHFTD